MDTLFTIPKFLAHFSSEENCLEYLRDIRWPDANIICPFCGCENAYLTLRGFACRSRSCKKKFTEKIGTIFQGTKLPLSVWFFVIFMMVMNKKNTSSRQFAKNMGITQKSMWYMMHKIRGLFWQDDTMMLSGIVEIDESFLGKGKRWYKYGSLSTRKAPILGIMERGGRLIIKCIPNREIETLEELIRKRIIEGSTVYTDGWIGYKNLGNWYNHKWVDHGANEYVNGQAHTNCIDGVWRQLKGAIRYGHHSIGLDHVQVYCDEVVYRINNRSKPVGEKFIDIVRRAITVDQKRQKEERILKVA